MQLLENINENKINPIYRCLVDLTSEHDHIWLCQLNMSSVLSGRDGKKKITPKFAQLIQYPKPTQHPSQ